MGELGWRIVNLSWHWLLLGRGHHWIWVPWWRHFWILYVIVFFRLGWCFWVGPWCRLPAYELAFLSWLRRFSAAYPVKVLIFCRCFCFFPWMLIVCLAVLLNSYLSVWDAPFPHWSRYCWMDLIVLEFNFSPSFWSNGRFPFVPLWNVHVGKSFLISSDLSFGIHTCWAINEGKSTCRTKEPRLLWRKCLGNTLEVNACKSKISI